MAGINGTVIIGGNEDDAITRSDKVSLTQGPDYPVNLNLGNDWIAGDGGNDTLKGFGGNDSLLGGDDNDRLLGDPGDDLLAGEEGDDLLFGGPGKDTFVIGHSGLNVIEDFTLGSTTDLNTSRLTTCHCEGGSPNRHFRDRRLDPPEAISPRCILGSAIAQRARSACSAPRIQRTTQFVLFILYGAGGLLALLASGRYANGGG